MTGSATLSRPRILDRDARISPCGRYRYTLTRRWGHSPAPRAPGVACWVGLNPSMADARVDDQTVRHIVDFSCQWGYDAVVVVNLFGLRATKPAALALAEDPVGPDNDQALLDACRTADLVIAAWGSQPLAVDRASEVLALLDQRSTTGGPFPMSCLGQTAAGQPRHPSRLARTASLEVFRTPVVIDVLREPLEGDWLPVLDDPDRPDWQEWALCAQADPEAFFPERGDSTREAKRICSGCGVRAEQLDVPVERVEVCGPDVWVRGANPHGDRGAGCPTTGWACPTCSLRLGPWAGERSDEFEPDGIVPPPCSVIGALRRVLPGLRPQRRRGRSRTG